jgi:hypothetical protein
VLGLGDFLRDADRVLGPAFARHLRYPGQIGKASRLSNGKADEVDVVAGQQGLRISLASIEGRSSIVSPDAAPLS